MKKIISMILVGVMLVSAFSLTGCAKKDSLDSLMVTYVTSPLNVPSIVEQENKFFAKNMESLGIEKVEYSNITSGADQTQALASGDIHFLNAVGATSVILSAANGADIKIISMYSRSPKAFRLFSSDENINAPEDLRGKTIAGPQGTILHELLVAFLASGDMTLEDINFVNTGIPEAMASLSSGSVDAALLAGAAAYNAGDMGMHLVTTGEGLVEATIVCATTDKFYKEHKDLVDAFILGQEESLAYMDSNEAEVISLVGETLDLDEVAVKEMYEYYDFDNTIKDSDIEALKATMKFMFDNDMIDNEVDVEKLVIK